MTVTLKTLAAYAGVMSVMVAGIIMSGYLNADGTTYVLMAQEW